MSVTTTLLAGAIKHISAAIENVMAVPGYDEKMALAAWELDNTKMRLEGRIEQEGYTRPEGEQLELGE